MGKTKIDLLVIGAGPGGYVAAIRAAQLGLNVVIVEKDHLGGICLNWGCIPTKALLRSAEVFQLIKNSKDYGISVKDFTFSLSDMIERSKKVSNQLSSGVKGLLKKNKVEVIEGTATLLGNNKVKIASSDNKTQELVADNIIIATGSKAKILPKLEVDDRFILTYKEVLKSTEMPKKLLVVGSGAIGIEFASFFNMLGADVTVVEFADEILIKEDQEISQLARKSLEKQGIKFLMGTKVLGAKIAQLSVKVELESKKKLDHIIVDKVISAVGVIANIDNIGIENTKAKVDKGVLVVDDFCKTHEPNMYAIGDIVQGPWLAHKASHEAVICVEHIAGLSTTHRLNRQRIPSCIYSHPQVASVGLTQAEANEKFKGDIKVGRFPFMGNGKAIALGDSEGMIKTIFHSKTGELVGAHMVGAEVTELIQGYTIAMNLETTEQELISTVFAHPTLSEMLHESVLNAFGRTIHY